MSWVGGDTNTHKNRQTDTHTHQYHDLAWPRGRAEWEPHNKTNSKFLRRYSAHVILALFTYIFLLNWKYTILSFWLVWDWVYDSCKKVANISNLLFPGLISCINQTLRKILIQYKLDTTSHICCWNCNASSNSFIYGTF